MLLENTLKYKLVICQNSQDFIKMLSLIYFCSTILNLLDKKLIPNFLKKK